METTFFSPQATSVTGFAVLGNPWPLLWIYLLLVNTAAFLVFGLDKWKAKRERWRVPEKTFFLVAILGGSLGAILGMYAFHHKTRHWYFKWGLPAILIAQIALGGWLYWHFFLA